jgi:hypothetical protein
MITITGLTQKQKAIMDILWACTSIEQAELFIRSMPTHKDRADAHTLMNIAVLETLEQEGALDAYEQAARRAIDCARLR